MNHFKQFACQSAVIAFCLLAKSSSPGGKPASSVFPPQGVPEAEAVAWRDGLRKAFVLEQKGDIGEAAATLAECEGFADRYPDTRFAATTFLYRGNNAYLRFDYADAMRSYLRARAAAQRIGDKEILSSAAVNLSSLYLQHRAVGDALQTGTDGVVDLPIPAFRALQRIQRAKVLATADEFDRAAEAFHIAVDEARRIPDPSIEALAWTSMGSMFLRARRLAEAEEALANAYRVESSFHLPHSGQTYRLLAELRLLQGEPRSALRLFDLGMDASGKENRPLLLWRYLHGKGIAAAAAGDLEGAHVFLRSAVEELHSSHLHLLPADALRVAGGARLSELYDAFVNVSTEAYLSGRAPGGLTEALAISDASRAAGLRNAKEYTLRWRKQAPPAYRDALREIEAAYATGYRRSAAADNRLRSLRLKLTETEASAHEPGGMRPLSLSFGLVERLRIPPNHAVILFHLGDRASYAFAGAGNEWEVHRLPSRGKIEQNTRLLSEAIENGQGIEDVARLLFRDLFGALSPRVAAQPHWLLALDGPLFRVPMAALLSPQGRYLVEDHSLQIVPGLWVLAGARAPVWKGPPVGIADPVYNAADPRYPTPDWSARFVPVLSRPDAMQLVRLPASAMELAAAESSLARPMVKLTGADASLEKLELNLGRQPEILHFAAHVLGAPETSGESLLALSAKRSGDPELLGPEWIASRDIHCRLVVMSGCRSGRGRIVPTEGLMGLARAWLYAGARNVVVTHWPTIDEQGALLSDFYSHWRKGLTAAESLRRAQASAARSESWNREPRHWAAYFLIGAPE